MKHTDVLVLGLVLLAVVMGCGPSEAEIGAIVDARIEEKLAKDAAIEAKAQAMAKAMVQATVDIEAIVQARLKEEREVASTIEAKAQFMTKAIIEAGDQSTPLATPIPTLTFDDYDRRGNEFYERGDYDRAIQNYTEAISLNSEYAYAYYGRGSAYYGRGDYELAIQDYNEAIILNPEYAPAYYGRGSAYYVTGDYERAVQDYDEGIRLDPDSQGYKEARDTAIALVKTTTTRDATATPVPLTHASDQKATTEPVKEATIASDTTVFSDEQTRAFLLAVNDFPKEWTAQREGMVVQATHFEAPNTVRTVKITLETHETEADAQTTFSAKKTETQTTIEGRGISGDQLEDVKDYPLFVWNASTQANIQGVEKWELIGVYGNITVKVFHAGSVGAPKKDIAVDIAKKQMNKIMGD